VTHQGDKVLVGRVSLSVLIIGPPIRGLKKLKGKGPEGKQVKLDQNHKNPRNK